MPYYGLTLYTLCFCFYYCLRSFGCIGVKAENICCQQGWSTVHATKAGRKTTLLGVCGWSTSTPLHGKQSVYGSPSPQSVVPWPSCTVLGRGAHLFAGRLHHLSQAWQQNWIPTMCACVRACVRVCVRVRVLGEIAHVREVGYNGNFGQHHR